MRGEATPVYMYWEQSPRRMWEYNPDLRIIMVLRDPIRRAFSHWQMEMDRGREVAGFSEAVRLEPARCNEVKPAQHRIFSYADRGYYSRQLRNLWQYFPRPQTLVLRHEEFVQNPRATLVATWRFLGLQEQPALGAVSNSFRNYTASLDSDTFDLLRSLFWSDVRELEALLQWDCSNWLQPD